MAQKNVCFLGLGSNLPYGSLSPADTVRAAIEALSDASLRGKTDEFRQRLANGASLDDLLEEAFAVAGQPVHASKAFKTLETPLVTFHTKAPLAMRKALQSRIVGAADA